MSEELNLINIYSWVTPIAVILLLAEMVYCYVARKNYISFQDAIANLGTGIFNQCVNLLVAFTVVTVFGYLYQYRFFTIPTTLTNFLILLVLFDFLFYWYHRHNHTINFLWAAHMPHHTSEEFNMFVAIRASITQRILSFTYLWPLTLLGFKPDAIYAASAVQLLIAFWHHTRVIRKMGWYEKIFNTPSYHRVHHAINERYLDKNFGEIFIIWDKMFGTYAEEKEEPVFGALTQTNSWNPNKIYFQYWSYLWDDARKTKKWSDKIRLWFMPLGWRPEDVRNNPRKRVTAETLVKFQTKVSGETKVYLVFSAVIMMVLMGITINLQLPFTPMDRVILSLIIWLGTTNWGGHLEGKSWAVKTELVFIALNSLTAAYLWNQSAGLVCFALQMTVFGLWRMQATSGQYKDLHSHR